MAEVVFRTSGSTGEPKTIVRRSEQLELDGAALAKRFAAGFSDAAFVASIRDEHFYGAVWLHSVPESAGLRCDREPVTGVESLAAKVGRYGKVVFVTTPSFLEKAVSHPDFASLRGGVVDIVASGSALRGETAAEVEKALGVSPLEIYGSTETGTIAWRRRRDGKSAELMDGVEAVADGEGRLVITASPYSMAVPFTMSDAVRFTGPRRFELLGRVDRMAKVLERFVSLSAVERAFDGHPLVSVSRAETCSEGVARIGLVAVLSAQGRAELARGTFAALLARLRHDLAPVLGAHAYPRRIRFVHALPVDSRGKTTAALVRSALAGNCREPVVLDWRATASVLEAKLVFPPDTECFDGHFPGFPVLAGVAQLFFIRHFAIEAFGAYPERVVYRKLKFRRVVRPSETVDMRLERGEDGAIVFVLSVGGEPAATGIVEEYRQ